MDVLCIEYFQCSGVSIVNEVSHSLVASLQKIQTCHKIPILSCYLWPLKGFVVLCLQYHMDGCYISDSAASSRCPFGPKLYQFLHDDSEETISIVPMKHKNLTSVVLSLTSVTAFLVPRWTIQLYYWAKYDTKSPYCIIPRKNRRTYFNGGNLWEIIAFFSSSINTTHRFLAKMSHEYSLAQLLTKSMIWTSTISVTLLILFSTPHKNSPLNSTHVTQLDFPNQYSTPLFFKKVTSSGSLQQQIHFLSTKLWFYFLSVDVIKEKFRSKRYLFDLINIGNISIVKNITSTVKSVNRDYVFFSHLPRPKYHI